MADTPALKNYKQKKPLLGVAFFVFLND